MVSKHHLIFTRHDWNKGYAHKLRKALVYNIPDDVHRNLHKAVAPIPLVTEQEARELFVDYRKHPDMGMFDALEWLIENAPASDFALAVMGQYLYLRCTYETSD